MLIDMIHDNHGEPAFKTRYRDPAVLKAYGYEAVIIPDALVVTPLAHRGGASVAGPTTYTSIAEVEASVDRRVKAAADAGMKVFFYGDAMLIPRHIVQAAPQDFLCDDGSGRLCVGKPAVWQAMEALVADVFKRWPAAEGLVMRTGEVYPEATPHMIGTALHEPTCPTCRGISYVERMRKFIHSMYRATVEQQGKMYVHRAWQRSSSGATMHDDPTVYRDVMANLPQSDKLCISFKFTRGDFRPGLGWNPCIALDQRPKWVEFQCEREFEGKGAIPNFQAPIWREFLASLKAAGSTAPISLWGWSRGGGWGGPYVQREEWIDANVYSLATLYRHPANSAEQIAREWAGRTFQLQPNSTLTDDIVSLLLKSAATIQQLAYSPADRAGEISCIRDDLMDVEVIWSSAAQLMETNLAERACTQKLEALDTVEKARRAMEQHGAECGNKFLIRDITNTIVFYNSLAGSIAHLFCGFLRFLQWRRGGKADNALRDQAREHLERAQGHWQHHTQRHAMLPGVASVFQENTFWDRTNDCLEELMNG